MPLHQLHTLGHHMSDNIDLGAELANYDDEPKPPKEYAPFGGRLPTPRTRWRVNDEHAWRALADATARPGHLRCTLNPNHRPNDTTPGAVCNECLRGNP